MRRDHRGSKPLLAEPRFVEFASRFDAGRYFAAHEILEELWLETSGDERDLLQGLVQVAVALEHHVRGNRAGAEKVLHRAKLRLRRYGAHHLGLRVEELVHAAEAWLRGDRPEPPRLDLPAHGSAEDDRDE